MADNCIHCNLPIKYDDYYGDWVHLNGDPQCTNPFTLELLSQWAEPRTTNG